MRYFIAAALVASSLACQLDTTGGPEGGGTARGRGARPGLTFSTITLDGYCEALAQAECHRLEVCQPIRLASLYGTSATCRAERTTGCEGAFIEDGPRHLTETLKLLTFDASAMGRAMSDFSRRHCSSSVAPPTTFAGARGAVPNGSPCSNAQFCVSGQCNLSGRCGVCGPRTEPPPPACGTCRADEICRCEDSDAGTVCGCTATLREGQSCATDRSLCAEGTRCLERLDREMNRREICVADPFEGEPCGPNTGTSACVGDSYCDLETARCRAPVLVSQGQACDTTRRLCPAGTDCRGVCVPRALEGEACTQTTQTTIPDGGPATCASGLCAGRCTELRTENQFCRRPSQCAAGLGCNLVAAGNGRCLTWDAVRAQIDQQFVCP